ncbi:MAG TPA: choice-of-anchor Q domain-containing protein, partial [Rhodanobacteraceae bacterium]|nr:choice-of-anchor Q domain-containing protein [Rhodanobacteraceae bacterium]
SKAVNLYDSAFTGNRATGTGGNPGSGGNGGAIGVDGDARYVNLCRVKLAGNVANAFGGGLFTVTYSADSFTRIEDSTVSGNTSSATDKLAGGAYIQGSPLIVSGSTFADNAAAGYAGLALFGQGGVLEGSIVDSTFVGNVARTRLGGAIGVDGDARYVNLCRVTLDGNISNAFGGGLFTVTYSDASFTRIEDSTLEANVSNAGNALAGGAYIQGSPLSISGSTFRDNEAAGYAGLALFGQGGVLEGSIVNSTFVGNTARTGLGGAMSIAAATSLTLENVTIARNTAPCDVCFAAGIANDSGAALTLRNVIFEDNVGGNIYNPWAMLHPAANGAANLQWPQSRGSGQTETAAAPGTTFAAAGLADPADNGGPTETMAIGQGSPALDSGTSASALPVDQRGLPRVGAVDIGAYEYQGDAIFANGFDAGTRVIP